MIKRDLSEIELNRPEYFEKIIQLADKEFGYGYLKRETLQQFFSLADSGCLILKVDNCFAGYSLLKCCKPEELNEITGNNFNHLIHNYKRTGYRFQTVVDKKFAGRGYGNKLIDAGNLWLKKMNAELILATVWLKEEKSIIAYALEKRGFIRVATINGFWKEKSIRENFKCKICGEPPCNCKAGLFLYYCETAL